MENIRKKLDEDLLELKRKLLQLGRMSEDALTRAVWAIKKSDTVAAKAVIDGDDEIDALTETLDNGCTNFIARYQPLGQDLRTVQSITHIAIDLERIADYGVNIARIAVQMGGKEWIKPLIDVPRMVETISEMMNKVLSAFDTCDIESARSVFALDETVDELEKQVIRELFLLVMEKPSRIEQSFMLMNIARTLERAGDHVTNVAERVCYICTGKRTKASEHKKPREYE